MILDFLNKVEQDLRENGFKLYLVNGKKTSLYHLPCLGYFSQTDKELVVAVGEKDWVSTLAHEYSHFCQWKEETFVDEDSLRCFDDYENWIEGKIELEEGELNKVIKTIQECELDCEIRTVDLLYKMNLLSNKEQYIKSANNYVWSYEVTKYSRKYNFDKHPSEIKEIYDLVPTEFISDVSDIPKEYLDKALEMCYKKEEENV